MVRLIDADHLKWNVGGIKCGSLSVNYLNHIIDKEEPTVEAIPISFIQKRINLLHEMAEYDFEANGGYIGQAHVAEYELDNLLEVWRTEQEKQNDQTDKS